MTEQVRIGLRAWVDPAVIADTIIQELESQGIEVTLDNAKKVWNDVLEHEIVMVLSISAENVFRSR